MPLAKGLSARKSLPTWLLKTAMSATMKPWKKRRKTTAHQLPTKGIMNCGIAAKLIIRATLLLNEPLKRLVPPRRKATKRPTTKAVCW